MNLMAPGRRPAAHIGPNAAGVQQTIRAPPSQFPLPMAPSSVAAALLGMGNGCALAPGCDPLKPSMSHHNGGGSGSQQASLSSLSCKFGPLDALMQQKQLELFQRCFNNEGHMTPQYGINLVSNLRAALEAIDNRMRAAASGTGQDNAELNGLLKDRASTPIANVAGSRKRRTPPGAVQTRASPPTHRLKITTSALSAHVDQQCAANSIAISMEVDGTTYEGVLYAASNGQDQAPQPTIILPTDEAGCPTAYTNGPGLENHTGKGQPEEVQNEDARGDRKIE